MKPKKAIEIKEQEQLFHPRVHDPDKWDANQLSIEALEVVIQMRDYPFPDGLIHLPSETDEE